MRKNKITKKSDRVSVFLLTGLHKITVFLFGWYYKIRDDKLEYPKVSVYFIAITYMLYVLFWEAFIIGGFGYAIFFLNRSGWWMILAFFFSIPAYTPESWRKLFYSLD